MSKVLIEEQYLNDIATSLQYRINPQKKIQDISN